MFKFILKFELEDINFKHDDVLEVDSHYAEQV